MKIAIIGIMCAVGLYGFLHLGEIAAFYGDPKSTVWQQISLRINLGFMALSLILCLCTLAVLDALERHSPSAAQSASPVEDAKTGVTPPVELTNEQRLEAIRKDVGNPILQRLIR